MKNWILAPTLAVGVDRIVYGYTVPTERNELNVVPVCIDTKVNVCSLLNLIVIFMDAGPREFVFITSIRYKE